MKIALALRVTWRVAALQLNFNEIYRLPVPWHNDWCQVSVCSEWLTREGGLDPPKLPSGYATVLKKRIPSSQGQIEEMLWALLFVDIISLWWRNVDPVLVSFVNLHDCPVIRFNCTCSNAWIKWALQVFQWPVWNDYRWISSPETVKKENVPICI